MGKNSQQRRKAKQAKAQRRLAARGGPRPGQHDEWGSVPLRTLVHEGMIIALNALDENDEATFDDVVRSLTAELRRLTKSPDEAERVLVEQLFGIATREVHRVWRRHWWPHEVVRQVVRALGAKHEPVIVDLIAHQRAAQGTPDGVPASFYDAVVLPDAPAVPVQMWRRWAQSGQSSADQLGRVLRVAWSIGRLPAVEPIGGTPSRADVTDEKQLTRIRALLAKAESTTFPKEAEALTAKAQDLMARFSIDRAVVAAATGSTERPVLRRLPIDEPYFEAKAALLNVVSLANRTRAIMSTHLAFVTVVGFPTDLDLVEILFTSLLVQATSTMAKADRQQTGGRVRAYRQSFLVAFANRIGARLKEATAGAESDAAATLGSSLLPVLVARADAVDEVADAAFPEVTKKNLSINHRGGWAAGTAAADRADLAIGGGLERAGRPGARPGQRSSSPIVLEPAVAEG